jgi:hypothetical protein
MSRRSIVLITLAVFTTLIVSACYRGHPSDKPPIHLNPNMDTQDKYKPQSESRFFPDGATMRRPVPGTVARGELREDSRYYFGKDEQGNYLTTLPVSLTHELLERGRERYNIYCAPCHGLTGAGNGIITKYNYPIPPPSFHQERLRTMPDGQLFDTITNGIRNMPSYKHQIPVRDRWAIVSYVRALQRSQNATLSDVPETIRSTLK